MDWLVGSCGRLAGRRRRETALALLLAGLVGIAPTAGGDHHGGGGPVGEPQEDCSRYPWWCAGQCAELNACRSGNNPIGGTNCQFQESNLRLCQVSPPPVPPAIVVPPPPDGDGEDDEDDGDGEGEGDGSESGCGEDADGDGECDPPGVRIEPGSREYHIDTSGRMPRIEFKARMSNADAYLERRPASSSRTSGSSGD